MEWVYDDGGRSRYFKAKNVGDCVCRSVAIATGIDYKEVYDAINALGKQERITKRNRTKSTARDGVSKKTQHKLMEQYGWKWVPTMTIGSGCKVHLNADELPSGRIVCQLSKHSVAVIDGVVHDTYDPTRDEGRCVYGYWYKPRRSGKAKPRISMDEFKKRVGICVDDFLEGYMTADEFGKMCGQAAKDVSGR